MNRLKELRKERGYTQVKMQMLTGIDQSDYSKIEKVIKTKLPKRVFLLGSFLRYIASQCIIPPLRILQGYAVCLYRNRGKVQRNMRKAGRVLPLSMPLKADVRGVLKSILRKPRL